MSRDQLVLRYLSALDAGSIEEMQSILAHAESDPILAKMLVETHEAYEPNIYQNGHATELPPARKAARGTRGHWVALVAAALTLLLTSVIISSRPSSDSNLLAEAIPFDRLQPITADNINRLTHLATLGTGMAFDVDWSPDGEWFAISSASGVYIHDADALNAEPTLLGGRSMTITKAALNPTGTILAGAHRNSVILWNTSTGEVLHVIDTNEIWISFVQFNAAGDQLATAGCVEFEAGVGCHLYRVRLWDLATGEETHSLEIENHSQLALTPDFAYLAYDRSVDFGEPRFLVLVDVATGEIAAEIESPNFRNSLRFAFNSDGSKLVVGGIWQGSNVRIFDVNSLVEQEGTPEPDAEELVMQAGPEFSFTTFLPGDTELLTLGRTGYLTIRDAETGEQIRNTSVDVEFVLAAAVDPQVETFVVVDSSGLVRLFDLETGDLRRNLLRYGTNFSHLGFNDHMVAASGTSWSDAPARLWNLNDLVEPEQVIAVEATSETLMGVADFAFSPEGTELAYIVNRSELHIRNLLRSEDRVLTTVPNDSTLTFTEAGALIVLTPYERLLFQDTHAQRETIPLPGLGQRDYGRSLTGISSDGQLIVNGIIECSTHTPSNPDVSGTFCTTTALDLWTNDLQTRLARLESGQTAEMPSVVTISPDNQLMAYSTCAEIEVQSIGTNQGFWVRCKSGEILVWDIRNLDENGVTEEADPTPPFAILEDYAQIPIQMAFAPTSVENRHLLATTTSSDGNIRFWVINPEDETYELIEPLENLDEMAGASNVAFDQSGTLVAASYGGRIQIWGVVD